MQNELTGAIKNALEKGENMTKVKKSFTNAGYAQRDVDAAVAELSASTIQPVKIPQSSQISFTTQQSPKLQQKSSSKFPTWLIIVIILAIIILIGAALLGFFFEDIMQALFK